MIIHYSCVAIRFDRSCTELVRICYVPELKNLDLIHRLKFRWNHYQFSYLEKIASFKLRLSDIKFSFDDPIESFFWSHENSIEI